MILKDPLTEKTVQAKFEAHNTASILPFQAMAIKGAHVQIEGELPTQLTGTMPGAFELNGNEPESVTVPLALESGYEFLFVALKLQYNQRGYWTFAVLPVMTQEPKTVFEDLHRAVEVLGSHNLRMHGDESGTVTIEFVPKAS